MVDAIVEAAAHLLAMRGWAGATTNHIAARAGVSIGSVYKYFPNKPSIVAEVARRRIVSEVSAIAATFAAHADDPRAALAAMVAAMAARYAENAAVDTALMELLGPIEVARFLRDAEAEVVRMTESYLARHPDVLRAGEESAAFVAVHALRGVCIAAAARSPSLLATQSFRQELVRMLERCLLRPPGPPAG
jgi:AcrR family transcriptional regulator